MVAVKKMKCNAAEEMLHQMKRESAILLRVANDPNIVQFFGTCLCNPPMICMEFMEVRPAPKHSGTSRPRGQVHNFLA